MNQKSIKTRGVLVGIVIWTFITFYPTIKSFFVLDDFFWIHFYRAFSLNDLLHHYNFFSRIQCDGFYRPMISYFYGLDFLAWGLNPLGYHITNVAFHVFNVILVDKLVYELTRKKNLSLCTAFLFALHPLHVGAVVYISGRTELVYCFFVLLSIIFFIKNIRESKGRYFVLSLCFFTCALFSKETTIAFLVVLGATQYLLNKKIYPLRLFPYLALSGGFFFIRQYAIRVPLNKYGFELGVENFTRLIYNYILVIIPINVKSIYSSGIVTFFIHNFWALTLFFLVFAYFCYTAFAFLVRSKKLDVELVIYWLIWLLVSFFPIFFMSGDRLSYAPSIASSCITAMFFLSLFKGTGKKTKPFAYLIILLIGTFFFSWTLERSVIYNHVGTLAEGLLTNIKKARPVLVEESLVILFNYPNDWIRDDTNWLRTYYGCLDRALEVKYRKEDIKVAWVKGVKDDAQMLAYLRGFDYKGKYSWGKNIVVLKNERFKILDKTVFFEEKLEKL